MNYHWINLFNMIEEQGGFSSVEEAKQSAVSTYNRIQNGMALHIGIGDDNGPICEGSIRDGKWLEGRPILTKTQQQIGSDYRRMTK